ncbi:hypothetical protein LSTR_LSTR008624 [Laodelphax striatellus]|uniref:PHD-type domain-containing protein n=1 Tax=Laodelphax striatellus TaxID=195883 RepID=A0A482WZS7_LAOST|nr:hypothetical protein LSTR_LSTR008624 [Laodelphax striatellus]
MSTKIIRNPETNCEVLVSSKEEKFRKNFPSFEETKDKEKQFKCTVCCVNLIPFIATGKSCHVHAFLKVLVCKKCFDFYGYGDFSTDEDGDEKYCRWCGQGGNLFLCEKCNSGFCKACVKRNFNRAVFEELKDQDNWECFMCAPEPLFELRAKAWVAEKHYLSLRKEDKKSKSKAVTPEEEASKEKQSKEDKSFKSQQKFIDTARKLMLESLDESKRLSDQCKVQAEKIQKTKMSKKHVKDVEAIKSLESKLHVFFNSITENVQVIKTTLTKNLADWQMHYDERFTSQTNGDDKPQENGCDEGEGEGGGEAKEEGEQTEGGEEEGENGKVEDDKKDNVENGDDEGLDDTKKDEEVEEKDEPMETSLNETGDAEVTRIDESDADASDDKNTTVISDKLNDSECEEPASKISKT